MYKIVGADQKEYGPISADQVRQWISEGRANAQTLARFEDGPWKPLSTFTEFAPLVGSPVPPPLGFPSAAPVASAGSIRKTNGLALTGTILGFFGLFCCTPVMAPLGLIFSCIGLYQIKRNPERYSGTGLAVTGIVTSIIGLIIFAILLATGVLDELMRNLPNFAR
ncbi:MAG: DUF4190 domain-containing protein [Verrucomicrobia bacterium]|nr:DUF4190 domain-containing protein [Verrucomicrobiota bacterium]